MATVKQNPIILHARGRVNFRVVVKSSHSSDARIYEYTAKGDAVDRYQNTVAAFPDWHVVLINAESGRIIKKSTGKGNYFKNPRVVKKNATGGAFLKAAVTQFKRLLDKGLSVDEAKRWMKSNWSEYLDADDLKEITAAATARQSRNAMRIKKSKGHLGFARGWTAPDADITKAPLYEYFTRGGDIIKALQYDPVMPDGYRAGRFEATDTPGNRRYVIETFIKARNGAKKKMGAEGYRVMVKFGKERPQEFWYKDRSDAATYARAARQDGAKVTVTDISTGMLVGITVKPNPRQIGVTKAKAREIWNYLRTHGRGAAESHFSDSPYAAELLIKEFDRQLERPYMSFENAWKDYAATMHHVSRAGRKRNPSRRSLQSEYSARYGITGKWTHDDSRGVLEVYGIGLGQDVHVLTSDALNTLHDLAILSGYKKARTSGRSLGAAYYEYLSKGKNPKVRGITKPQAKKVWGDLQTLTDGQFLVQYRGKLPDGDAALFLNARGGGATFTQFWNSYARIQKMRIGNERHFSTMRRRHPKENAAPVANGAFSWSVVDPRRLWVLSYNGETFARLVKSNDFSKWYTFEIVRGGGHTFEGETIAQAKAKALAFARKEFPGYRSYKQSQPTLAYVNRNISKAAITQHGAVVRLEPVAFDQSKYRLTFADGYTAETKIPKARNPRQVGKTKAQVEKLWLAANDNGGGFGALYRRLGLTDKEIDAVLAGFYVDTFDGFWKGYAFTLSLRGATARHKKRNGAPNGQDFSATKRTELAAMFQGGINGARMESVGSEHTPDAVTRLGRLSLVKIANGRDRYELKFKRNSDAWLTMDARTNLHIFGSDSQIDNLKLPTKGNLTLLGKLEQINYITRKNHIENGELVEYYHKLGEVDGILPDIYADSEGFLVINSGNYNVGVWGIEN